MKKHFKIKHWVVNFLEIDRIEKNKIVLHTGEEISLNAKEKDLFTRACERVGMPEILL